MSDCRGLCHELTLGTQEHLANGPVELWKRWCRNLKSSFFARGPRAAARRRKVGAPAQGGDVIEPCSAGIEKHAMNRHAVKVMAEAGVDISKRYSKTPADLGPYAASTDLRPGQKRAFLISKFNFRLSQRNNRFQVRSHSSVAAPTDFSRLQLIRPRREGEL